MHRVDTDGNVSGMFSDGDPTHGVQATVVDDDWLNDVQENIVAVVLAGGLSLIKGTYTQLRDAISAMITAALVTFRAATNSWSGTQTFGTANATTAGITTANVGTLNVSTAATFPASAISYLTLGVGSNISGQPKVCAYKDLAGNVHIEGAWTNSGDVSSVTAVSVGGIPSGLRPAGQVNATVYAKNNAGTLLTAAVGITSNGAITIASVGSDFKSVQFNIVFNPAVANGP
jgi:hypothetical protein